MTRERTEDEQAESDRRGYYGGMVVSFALLEKALGLPPETKIREVFQDDFQQCTFTMVLYSTRIPASGRAEPEMVFDPVVGPVS